MNDSWLFKKDSATCRYFIYILTISTSSALPVIGYKENKDDDDDDGHILNVCYNKEDMR
jgi:hypothetical protein